MISTKRRDAAGTSWTVTTKRRWDKRNAARCRVYFGFVACHLAVLAYNRGMPRSKTATAKKESERATVFPEKDWLRALRTGLLKWYGKNARTLPWRGTRDPYRVWVSEIMLQQTQVETVKPYFVRFIDAFPNVAMLAKSPEEKVLRLWGFLCFT